MNSKLFVLSLLLIGLAFIGFAQPAPPGGPPFTITEIMFNPPEAGVDSLEFIEIRNPDPVNQRNIGGYSFASAVDYTFPINTIIEPHAYVIVAIDSVAFENTFALPAFQWTSGALSNNGEPIVLHNLTATTVDSVAYENGAPWPTEADGNGHSLTLCVDTLDNALVQNWSASQTNTGIVVNGTSILATPGAGCGIPDGIESVEQYQISIYPNPSNGSIRISTEKNAFDTETTIRVYDLSGKLIESKSLKLGFETDFSFSEKPPSGTYVVSLENEKARYHQSLLILE